MERKIGDVFTFNGKQLEVIEGCCKDCYFLTNFYCFKSSVINIIGECYASKRKDNNDICFKLVGGII